MCDTLAVVTLTEAPEADLVEVVETDGTSDGVEEDRIGDGGGDDIG